MEENFEKKSSKKVGIIITVVVILLIIAAMVGGVTYINSTRKPEKIFAKTIEDVFEMVEVTDSRKEKAEVELSAELEANDPEVKAINEFLKVIKLKLTTEIDLDKEIFNANILATYNNMQVISLDTLIQNERAYIYLKDLYSKYIELDEEYLEGVDLSTLFTTPKTINEDLITDIKQIILDEVNSREFTQEKIKLNDENVLKTTLRLTPKEVLEISIKMLNKINEYENIPEFEEAIEDLKMEMEYLDETENYLDISIYTKGLKNELVKAEFLMINKEDEEAISLEIEKNEEKEFIIRSYLNEEATSINEENEIMSITISKEDKNRGTIKLKFNVEDQGAVILNIKSNIDNNVNIEERNVSNSIKANSLTEEDAMEIMENMEKNDVLNMILNYFLTNQSFIDETMDNKEQLEIQQQMDEQRINEIENIIENEGIMY